MKLCNLYGDRNDKTRYVLIDVEYGKLVTANYFVHSRNRKNWEYRSGSFLSESELLSNFRDSCILPFSEMPVKRLYSLIEGVFNEI